MGVYISGHPADEQLCKWAPCRWVTVHVGHLSGGHLCMGILQVGNCEVSVHAGGHLSRHGSRYSAGGHVYQWAFFM